MPYKNSILETVKVHVTTLLTELLPNNFYYHNLNHTEEVVKIGAKIAQEEGFSEEEQMIVILAAWFHDVGHIYVKENHENRSIEVASEFLDQQGVSAEMIEKVCECIRGTIMPQNPRNRLAEVLCDADLYHLSSELFEERSELLKNELNEVNAANLDDLSWREKSCNFLQGHTYFTQYAKANFEPLKALNLKKAKKKLRKEKEKGIPSRGIETMFRTTSKNHLELSSIADNKANIMISINSIILSIIVSVLIRKLEEYPHFVLPTIIMTAVCLSTIVLSILATRPNVQKGRFTKEDINNRKVNLLFFGNFHQMSLQDYEWGMKEMMKDGEYLYGSMIKDIYFLGAVLGKKYKLLRLSYTVFMFGFVAAVLAFVIAELFFKNYYMY